MIFTTFGKNLPYVNTFVPNGFGLIWKNKMAAMPIFLLHFSPLTFYCRLATSQQSSCSCLLNQCTYHYTFPLEGRSNKLILHCRENFQPCQHIYYCTETENLFTFSRFEDGHHFQDGCHEATSCVFLFPFLD